MWREISGGGGKKPKVKFPQPTAEETALQKEQTEILRQQRGLLEQMMREQDLLAPFLYKQAGINPKFNDKGELIGFDEIADPLSDKRKAIEEGFLDRTLAAQRGELPVDPALLRDLRDQEATLNETMRRQLGPGWQTSSPGQEASQRFGESRNILLEGARRGDLTMGEQLGLAREMANDQKMNQMFARLSGITGRDAGGVAGLGGVAQGFNSPLASFMNNRQGQFGARSLNFQYDAYADPFTWRGVQRNLHQGAMAFLSTATAKKDIEPLDKHSGEALKTLRDTPHVRYRYKWEGPEQRPHTGPIYELSPKAIKNDDMTINVADYLGLTAAAVRDLDRDVQTLRNVIRRAQR